MIAATGRLSAKRMGYRDQQARLELLTLACNLSDSLRRLALPRSVRQWSLIALLEKAIKISAKVVRRALYAT